MDNGARFEYKINHDVKRSSVSVTLYIIIQRNGFITNNDPIATSKPVKYKKGKTDADSLEYVVANLKAGALKDLIAESRDLILYTYSEVIDPDKVTERFTDSSPSGITRAQAEAVGFKSDFSALGGDITNATQDLTPNGVAKELAKNQSFQNSAGTVSVTTNANKKWGNDDYSLRQIDGYEKTPETNKSAEPATPTDNKSTDSNKPDNFSVNKLNEKNELIGVSKSKGDLNNTTINNNNQANAITNSSIKTFSEVSNNSSTITDLYKSKSNWENLLTNKKDYTNEGINYAKKELASIDANLKIEIAKYNKENPGDNKYKTEAEVKKEQIKKETQNKKDSKTTTESNQSNKPAGVEKAMANLAEANKLAKIPKIENKPASKIGKIQTTANAAELPKISTSSTPTATVKETATAPDDLADKIKKNIAKETPLKFTSKVFDESTKEQIAGDSNITLKAEKEETNKAVKAGTAVKKEVIDVKKLIPDQATANQVKQNANLAALNNYARTIATNTSNTINNTSNNKTDNNAAAANEIKLDNTMPLRPLDEPKEANKPKEGSEPVDNSQSELNSQLLNAIYDLLSTGIKVKYS